MVPNLSAHPLSLATLTHPNTICESEALQAPAFLKTLGPISGVILGIWKDATTVAYSEFDGTATQAYLLLYFNVIHQPKYHG